MKFFKYMKDGGPESKVWGFFLAEIKSLFSVVLLRFGDGSREAFHSHAFNTISWMITGQLIEERYGVGTRVFRPSLMPVFTSRDNMHKVSSKGTSWVISFRGPWASTWKEFLPQTNEFVTLGHGRKVLERVPAEVAA